jgi:hypothetical protein
VDDASENNKIKRVLAAAENGLHPIPIKLVHSDIVTTGETPMNYEPPNTVLVDDSSKFV